MSGWGKLHYNDVYYHCMSKLLSPSFSCGGVILPYLLCSQQLKKNRALSDYGLWDCMWFKYPQAMQGCISPLVANS